MQDKNEVETKTVQAPKEPTRAEIDAADAKERARQAAETAELFRRARPPAEAWIVVMKTGIRVNTDTGFNLGTLNVVFDKPMKLERRLISKVAAYVAAQGNRLKFLELPENWKAWK